LTQPPQAWMYEWCQRLRNPHRSDHSPRDVNRSWVLFRSLGLQSSSQLDALLRGGQLGITLDPFVHGSHAFGMPYYMRCIRVVSRVHCALSLKLVKSEEVHKVRQGSGVGLSMYIARRPYTIWHVSGVTWVTRHYILFVACNIVVFVTIPIFIFIASIVDILSHR